MNCTTPTRNDNIIISLEIKEDNKKILLDIKNYLDGEDFYFINCPKLFMDEYFFGSIYKEIV